MDQIGIFDVASLYKNDTDSAWFSQKASGEIPDNRVDFCLTGISAPDNSSYNIYMYGGKNGTGAFDQIYALSLPSFTWVKIYEGDSPRYGHTCHPVGQRQMVTVGV